MAEKISVSGEKNKKEKKSSENVSSVPASPEEQPKKKNGCLVAAIIAIAFFLFVGAFILFWMWPFIFSFFMDLRNGDISLPKTTQTQNSKGTLHGKNLSSLVDPSKTVTKRISAKNGGQITVRTASGLYFTLKIAPGSLEKDTDITLTPISESPIEGYPNLDDPGVVIGPPETNLGDDSTVTVSEDPPVEPADPGGSAADPGTGTGPGGDPAQPNTPSGTTGDIPNFGNLAGLLGNNTITTTPSGNPSGQGGSAAAGNTGTNRDDRNTGSGNPSGSGGGPGRFSDKTVIIFTGYGGGVSGAPTSHSDDGDSATAPVDETGATSSDDPDEGESEDLADNAAAASGGTCSPEFLQVMANAANAEGAGSQAAQAAIRDCLNTEWLNNLCVNDPVKLRRTYFEQRIALARRIDERAGAEIESLMNQCQAKYHFYGGGVAPGFGGEVTLFSSLDANVCGYVDDKWTGTQVYKLQGEHNTGYDFSGTTEFSLPAGGGEFSGTSQGENSMAILGRGVAVPDIDLGFTGNFDGVKTITTMTLFPATVISSTLIELQGKDCVPLAPLPH
ncbi:MAG: hypothetical protein NT093_02840 [Candidatus Moranbacteria bacterium]|nr:hypothetical protein [Candidatus Moranbacteria bacterium]